VEDRAPGPNRRPWYNETMLRISTSDANPIIITPELTQPGVYLDHCVIADLSRDPARGQEVREALLAKGGMLWVSWVHLVELISLGIGPTFERIRAYLHSFGRSFVLIDSHVQAVIDREARWRPGRQNPAISEEFMIAWAAAWDGRTNLDLTTLLDVMTLDPALIPKYQALHRESKERFKLMFDDARTRYRTDRAARRRLDGATYPHVSGTPPTAYLGNELTRMCIVSNEAFTGPDALDFHHCVVSVAYCDFVVLDQKWTRRCRAIRLPQEAARVFSTVELDEFLAALRAWVPPAR